MFPKPRFCSQCGAPVETQVLDGQPRDVCSACGTVVHQSPPPLAASLVLNERREVLLVNYKLPTEPRPSASGSRLRKTGWRLPMGFAGPGETIADAARRELKQQTGVEACLVRLLDADSSESTEQGYLWIVTYEMEKVGGAETPGSGAEAVAYFPLSRHPELAFESHEKALRVCADLHLEDWAIRDSFERLQADQAKVMLSDALVGLIEERAAEVAQAWLADVRTNPTTASYASLDQDKLLERAATAFSQFGRWLTGREADQKLSDFYCEIGRERRAQGFNIHEVLSVLMLLKKHIWTFARNHGVGERPIDVYRVLELNRRIAVFFDKALYHAARGFESDNGG